MRVAIVGGRGQLGTDLSRAFAGHDIICWNRSDFDLRDHERTREAVLAARPEVVINTAAFHKTDDCETDPPLAFAVNAIAVRNLAHTCQECGATLAHISTDYVFDGKKREPYTEEDCPRPLNVYGVSKLAGEMFVASICRRHYIVRVASLFGAGGTSGKGANFVDKMIERGTGDQEIRVVGDVVMSPTYAADAARQMRRMIEGNVPPGVYHVTNSGSCSWHEFAGTIFGMCGLTPRLRACRSDDASPRARRPQNSALSSSKVPGAGLEPLRPWHEALRDYLMATGHLVGVG